MAPHNSGGSRNFERVVRLAHTLSQRTAEGGAQSREGGAQSREAAISPREARKNFLRVLFSDQEALFLVPRRKED